MKKSVKEQKDCLLPVIETLIRATHVGQIAQHLAGNAGDGNAFARPDSINNDRIDEIVDLHGTVLRSGPDKIAGLVNSSPPAPWPYLSRLTDLTSAVTLAPRLPVSAATAVLRKAYPGAAYADIRALANLLQITLEISRDADLLQDAFRFYLSLGFTAAPSDMGLRDSDDFFLETGRKIAAECCPAPYRVDAAAWQIALRKIQNWSLKHRRIENLRKEADALLSREDIIPLIPGIRALAPEKILVIGHSYTLALHWSTFAPFTDIVRAVFERENPGIRFFHLGEGGLHAARAREYYFEQGCRLAPERVILVTIIEEERDYEAVAYMAEKLRSLGAEMICLDRVHPQPDFWVNPDCGRLRKIADETGLTLLEVGARTDCHPERGDFIALDGVHTRIAHHRFLAAELLRFLLEQHA